MVLRCRRRDPGRPAADDQDTIVAGGDVAVLANRSSEVGKSYHAAVSGSLCLCSKLSSLSGGTVHDDWHVQADRV